MRWLVLLALSGCATLNTAGMSEHCRRLYDACLNTCPSSLPAPPVGTNLTTVSPQFDVASCTNDCNERARACK